MEQSRRLWRLNEGTSPERDAHGDERHRMIFHHEDFEPVIEHRIPHRLLSSHRKARKKQHREQHEHEAPSHLIRIHTRFILLSPTACGAA